MVTVDFSKLPLGPGARILDIGCGDGRHIAAAARLGPVLAAAADRDPEEAARAARRLAEQEELCGPNPAACIVLCADVLNLPFADGFFDLVICSEVLEHIPDHRAAAAELVRVLAPTGDLVVSVPRWAPESICWALSREYHSNPGGHIRIYRRGELQRLLESAGARVWARGFAHALHAPYWWLKCLTGPRREDSALVNLYHRFLVWDMMKRPRFTRWLEALLNPLMGKSLVLYLRKGQDA